MSVPKGETQQCITVPVELWRGWRVEANKRGVSGAALARAVMGILVREPNLMDGILDDDGLDGAKPYQKLRHPYLAKLEEAGGSGFNAEICKALGRGARHTNHVMHALNRDGLVTMERRTNGAFPNQWHVSITDAGRAAL